MDTKISKISFIFYLILSAWLFGFCCPAFAKLPPTLPGLVLDADTRGEKTFIRIGNHITYRRYFHYFTTREGLYSLFSGLVHMVLTGYVEYQAAREISSFASSPWTRRSLFFSTLFFMPLAIRSSVSWCASRRLGAEQVQIDSHTISERFYIELYYDPAAEREILKLLPVPTGLIRIRQSGDRNEKVSSLTLWRKFHNALLHAGISSVQLSWYEENATTGILAQFETEEGNTREEKIEIAGSYRLPKSIESLLHHELSHDVSYYQTTVSLLKDDIIQKIMELVAPQKILAPSLSLHSLVINILEREDELGYHINLCTEKSPECGTHLQLLWQAIPFPHFRPRLVFIDYKDRFQLNSALGATMEQVRDLNVAEQLIQLFEKLMFSAVMEFIRHQQEYAELYPPESPRTAVTNALINRNTDVITTDLDKFTMADWSRVLKAVEQEADTASMVEACEWLTTNRFDWSTFFLPATTTKTGHSIQATGPVRPATLPVLEHVPVQQQLDILDKMLEASPPDFIATIQKLPASSRLACLRVSEGSAERLLAIILLLDETQLNDFIDLLASAFGEAGEGQYSSLATVLDALSAQAFERLVSKLVEHKANGFDQLFIYLINNRYTKVFRLLADRPDEVIQRQLAEGITLFLTELNGEAGEHLLSDFLPMIQGNVIKTVVSLISQQNEPGSAAYNALGTLSTLLLQSPVHDSTTLLVDLIIEHASSGSIDVARQLVTDQELMIQSMEKALELQDEALNTQLFQLDGPLYFQHLLRLHLSNKPGAIELLVSVPPDNQYTYVSGC